MNLNYDRKPIDNPFKTTAYNFEIDESYANQIFHLSK